MFLFDLEIKEIVALIIAVIIAIIIILIIVSSIKESSKNRKNNKNNEKVSEVEEQEKPLNETVYENKEEAESLESSINKQPIEGEFVEEDEFENKVEQEEVEVEEELEVKEENELEPVIEENEASPIRVQKEKKQSKPAKEPEEEIAEDNIEESEETKANSRYAGKFEVFQEGDFYKYRLKASNGEVLVVSQMYKSKDSVYRSIESIKRNVVTGTIRILKDKTDMFTFKLVAKNHRVMAISSHYATEARAKSASESFQRFAISAEPVDIVLELDEVDFNSVLINVDKSEEKEGGKYVLVKDEILDWCWELSASNGQILCRAEGYTTKAGAQNSIANFKSNVKIGNFYVVKAKGGRFQFKLFSPQGRLVILGESYPVKASAESAAKSVCAFYKKAVLES